MTSMDRDIPTEVQNDIMKRAATSNEQALKSVHAVSTKFRDATTALKARETICSPYVVPTESRTTRSGKPQKREQMPYEHLVRNLCRLKFAMWYNTSSFDALTLAECDGMIYIIKWESSAPVTHQRRSYTPAPVFDVNGYVSRSKRDPTSTLYDDVAKLVGSISMNRQLYIPKQYVHHALFLLLDIRRNISSWANIVSKLWERPAQLTFMKIQQRVHYAYHETSFVGFEISDDSGHRIWLHRQSFSLHSPSTQLVWLSADMRQTATDFIQTTYSFPRPSSFEQFRDIYRELSLYDILRNAKPWLTAHHELVAELIEKTEIAKFDSA